MTEKAGAARFPNPAAPNIEIAAATQVPRRTDGRDLSSGPLPGRQARTLRLDRRARVEVAASLRSWALEYAAHRWPVFPLAPATNVPALPRRLGGRGVLDATTEPDVVRLMWDRYPLGNVGVATGRAAGIAALDVDPRHGGAESLARLVDEHGPLPEGPVATTPSGGWHRVLVWREGLRCSAGQLGPGLDVRSDGGYVAAAPSVRPDGRYSWAVDFRTPPGEWPDWLLPRRREPVPVPSRPVAASPDRVLAGLARTVAEAPEGNRNYVLYWSGRRLAEHASAGRVSLGTGVAVLLDAAQRARLSPIETERTLRSALRGGGAS